MLARGEPAGYDKTVAVTWSLAFGRLEQASPSAVGLLRLLAFCAPEAIPLSLLLRPRPGLPGQLGPDVAPVLVPLLEDPLAASDAVAALRRYSLVTPAADGSVSVHRLVQAVTIGQMTPELAGAWRQAAATVIEAAIPDDPREPSSWPVFGMLLPHAQAAIPPDTDGMARVASYLGYSGSFAAARDLCRTVLEAREQGPGPEHPDTLTARAELAHWTGEAGDPGGARDQYAALLPAIERVLGPEHPDTLAARGNLARWTGRAGDPGGARDQYAALLPVIERVLGPEHPYSLAARGNLARWTGEAGDPGGARDQYAALLPAMRAGSRPGAPGHPWPPGTTLPAGPGRRVTPAGPGTSTRRCCRRRSGSSARSTRTPWPPGTTSPAGPGRRVTPAGRGTSARRCCQWWSGSSARSTRTPWPPGGNLARWTGEAGDPGGARDQYAALLPVIERVLGPEHPDSGPPGRPAPAGQGPVRACASTGESWPERRTRAYCGTGATRSGPDRPCTSWSSDRSTRVTPAGPGQCAGCCGSDPAGPRPQTRHPGARNSLAYWAGKREVCGAGRVQRDRRWQRGS